MVKPGHAAIGTQLSIRILGKDHAATVIAESPYDAENKALKG
jgi:dimethylglycine dehydrogenase